MIGLTRLVKQLDMHGPSTELSPCFSLTSFITISYIQIKFFLVRLVTCMHYRRVGMEIVSTSASLRLEAAKISS